MDIVEFYNKVENIVIKDKNVSKSGYYIVSNKMIGSVSMSFKGWGHYIKISNLNIVSIIKGDIKLEESNKMGLIVVKSELIGLTAEQKIKVIKGLFRIMKELEKGMSL